MCRLHRWHTQSNQKSKYWHLCKHTECVSAADSQRRSSRPIWLRWCEHTTQHTRHTVCRRICSSVCTLLTVLMFHDGAAHGTGRIRFYWSFLGLTSRWFFCLRNLETFLLLMTVTEHRATGRCVNINRSTSPWMAASQRFTSRDRRSLVSRAARAVFNVIGTRPGTVTHHQERMSRWLQKWFPSLTLLVAAHEVRPRRDIFRNRKLRHDKLFDGALRCSLETTMLIVYNCPPPLHSFCFL